MQTFGLSQLNHFPLCHPAIAWEMDHILIGGSYFYQRAEPVILWQEHEIIFLQSDKQQVADGEPGCHFVLYFLGKTNKQKQQLQKLMAHFSQIFPVHNYNENINIHNLTIPVLKSLPKLSSLVRSLSPCVPIRVMNILSKVPAWVMEPVVTSTSYMASMALKKNRLQRFCTCS